MKTSSIVDMTRRPASPLSSVLYSTKSKEVLQALVRSDSSLDAGLSLSKNDTSVYEFPGDRTYQQYLRGN